MLKKIDPKKFIEVCSNELKKIKEIKPIEWSLFVKTGVHKERPPVDKDWWYIRAASILRKIYLKAPIGVSHLRKEYGGGKNRGHKPERFRKASGNIIRKILQQLEAAKLIEKSKDPKKKGRILTEKGIDFIRKICKEVEK